jgi:hypothetical protein
MLRAGARFAALHQLNAQNKALQLRAALQFPTPKKGSRRVNFYDA